ncbi:MAG TPA: biotin/lipoate--protein ligase family protein [Thermohalobaculum sp.]|nr:biotin/lipoate--protein ligase family protein [Thermohalobaculum sp.]
MTLDMTPTFPPLMRGDETPPGMDPFAKAVAQAALGADPGLVTWSCDEAVMRAALVLAPEVPLARAMAASFAVALGLGDAIGALAPPEVAVHYVWPRIVKVNGGDCGQLRAAASTADPAAEPDWLVVGVHVDYLLSDRDEPGRAPEQTCLVEEGCIEVRPYRLLESWSRHTLVWINRWLDDGFPPLHDAWRARAWRMGEALPGGGLFVGLDELGGMLVRKGQTTQIRPLTSMLEDLA